MPVDLEGAIIPAVVRIAASVDGVANVNDHIVAVADEATFKAAFFDAESGRIHGYTVTREKTDVEESTVSAAKDLHTIVIRGYMSVKEADGTEKLMQNEVEAIRAAFMANRHLEDQNGNRLVFWCRRIAVRMLVYAKFMNVLCHYAELVLVVLDYPID